jgi:hypothetical protein
MRLAAGLLPALIACETFAAPWTFADPVTVADAGEATYFHHLDGASRQHIASNESGVALVFEDDRSGAPQVYLVTRTWSENTFQREHKLSFGEEAYEPAVVALDDTRWLVAFEQDGRIVARVVGLDGAREGEAISQEGARQVSLAAGKRGLVAAYVREVGGGQIVEVADLRIDEDRLAVENLVTLGAPGDHPFQGYPSVAFTSDDRLLIAWEDRRAGHTRLFFASRPPGGEFGRESQLNEHRSPTDDSGAELPGLGTGVMRVVLAAGEGSGVQASWLDKRSPASGYAVWGARSLDAGRSFGANTRIQDELGESVQQWHASVAAAPGGFVAAWDDSRSRWQDEEEAGDVMISWNFGEAWSEDLAVPGASGPGYQGSPAIHVDADGALHLAWIERDGNDASTRLRYLHANPL